MLATIASALPDVALPPNITRIQTQADLYQYGVRLLRFKQVADEAEAVEAAGIERAFLLKSQILPCYYLIFPTVIVTEYAVASTTAAAREGRAR